MVVIKCDLNLDNEQFDKYADFLKWLKIDKREKNKKMRVKNHNEKINEINH